MPADLYDVLGTSTDASAEEIKRAYRERVRKYHPDVNDHPKGDEQFKLIRKAHDVLSDPAERKDYDRLGHREYVEKHLDDLPPVSVFPDEDLPEGTTTSESADDRGGDESSSTTATSASGSATGTSSSSASASDRSSASSSSSSSSAAASGASTSSSRRSSTGTQSDERSSSATTSSTTESASGGSTSDSTTAGAERDSWDAAAGATRTTTSAADSAGARRRRGLKRWYGVVAVSLLTYLAGLSLYGYTRLDALRSVVADLTASPASVLLGPFPLASPTEYVVDAARAATAGSPELGLVLLAGTALLPLVVLTAVGRFGRGAAWVYALPSLAPAACLGLWTAIAVPTWLALVGLVLLPILSGGGFLVDVGRYLRATR